MAILVATAVVCIPDWGGSDSSIPEVEEEQSSNAFSAQIAINNPEWGSVTVKENSFNGTTVTYTAVPNEGYHFSYWMDSNGRYIPDEDGKYNNPDITYERLDRVMTTAIFSEGDAEYSNLLTYEWFAPVYGNDGSFGSVANTFNAVLTKTQYENAKDLDVHRKAVAGNTYIVPWECVMDDSAVEQCVEYLEQKTVGQTDLQKAMTILWFVQDVIAYQTDNAQYGIKEYWATPLETLYSGKGDCEDTAVLYCSIAAKMGLDVGLVGFSYSDSARASYGHMGAAVALTGNASVQNATTFTMDGITYVYCETADSGTRIDMGILAYNSNLDLYRISDGTWTRIGYDPTTGLYTHENTRTIGANSNSGEAIYGDVLEAPVIELKVGDTFAYQPQVNMAEGVTMSASGNGLVSEGGFLTFNSEDVISGTAKATGEFSVVITAVWTNGVLSQTAQQLVKFSVSDAPASYSAQSTELQYNAGQWNIVSTDSGETDSDGDNPLTIPLGIVVGLIAIVLIAVAVRIL